MMGAIMDVDMVVVMVEAEIAVEVGTVVDVQIGVKVEVRSKQHYPWPGDYSALSPKNLTGALSRGIR